MWSLDWMKIHWKKKIQICSYIQTDHYSKNMLLCKKPFFIRNSMLRISSVIWSHVFTVDSSSRGKISGGVQLCPWKVTIVKSYNLHCILQLNDFLHRFYIASILLVSRILATIFTGSLNVSLLSKTTLYFDRKRNLKFISHFPNLISIPVKSFLQGNLRVVEYHM